jgi:uncharacterized protein YutE (UPF0331/DUF86 family)
MDDVLLNKFASIEKCIKRINDEYIACAGDIGNDILRQDSIVLNLERACEQCFDMGQRVIREKKLDLAKEYRDIFLILAKNKIIPKDLSESLQKMVGFRNLAIHEYTAIDIERLKYIIEHRVKELSLFARTLITFMDKETL